MTGVEADYDDGVLSALEAVDRLTEAGITALVYETPGSTLERPKWRVLAPFSRELEPGERDRPMARLHGLFGGVFDPASFTLSQAYYAGNVEGKPDVGVRLVKGRRYLDEADDLDAGAIGRPGRSSGGSSATAGVAGDRTYLPFDEFADAVRAIPNDDASFDVWLKIAMAVHHESAASDEGRTLAHEWSERSTKYDADDLDRRWGSFGRNGGATVTGWEVLRLASDHGWRNPAKKRALESMPPSDVAIDPVTARLNKSFAAVRLGGRTLVAESKPDGSFDLGSVDDLHRWHENDLVLEPGGRAREPASKHWMRDPDRRQYRGIVFDPSGHAPPAALNLWTGWAVAPEAGATCERIVEHVREVVCDGKPKQFGYVIGWLAHLVQRPAEKPGVALVLKGGKGAGKDTLAEVVRRIVGQRHVAHVDNPERLTSRFNAGFATAIVGHVEEAFWAGDRAKKGALQALITSPTMTLERKGIDPIVVDSFLRLIMTTNEDWAVPASADERRYAIFDVSDFRIGDRKYFSALYAEIEGDGPAAFLNYLLGVDLTDFEPRDVPQTAALRDQKVASLQGFDRWWFDILHEGVLPGDRAAWESGEVEVPRDALRDSYDAFIRDQRFQGAAINATQFGQKLNQVLPSVQTIRPRSERGARLRLYVVPILDRCREEFEAWITMPVDWGA
ncbi:DUF5906 domain-containing protein [Hansschlegelia plantiphila]|uniref:DUF5906 domain-containing protein n=1 Tax=Hansschlegelia plantiphila TaxID=374655 RepID=UPI0022F29652|nr:DUF5906 domain-containing protein [Hansschlegelia plantiphila]